MDSLVEAAKKLGRIRTKHFRVMVLESDLRRSSQDFRRLEEAKSYADDAASESDDNTPIAIVVDSTFKIVHKGRPYYLRG